MSLTIHPATADDLVTLDADLCPEDRAEIDAAEFGVSALAGFDAKALKWRGRLVCLFGLAGHPGKQGAGVPWMLSTNVLAEVPKSAMARVCRQVVGGWMEERGEMQNHVHSKNARAIRLVRWLGFTVDPEPVGPRGEFYAFHWGRHV